MFILAIDSATPVAGVALLDDKKLIREELVNFKKTHSESLMPMVDRLLTECELGIGDLTAIALTIGPGSFTGLRIGMATAKGLHLASAKPVVGVSTLEVMAHNISYSDSLVCPILDARKQELYTAFFSVQGPYPKRLTVDIACSPEKFAVLAEEKARQYQKEKILLLGDGYFPYQEFFQSSLGTKLVLAPKHLMLPRASALGNLALKRVAKGDYDDVSRLAPVYVRLSEAEYRLQKGEL